MDCYLVDVHLIKVPTYLDRFAHTTLSWREKETQQLDLHLRWKRPEKSRVVTSQFDYPHVIIHISQFSRAVKKKKKERTFRVEFNFVGFVLPWPRKSLQPRNSWGWSAVWSCDIVRYRASVRHRRDSRGCASRTRVADRRSMSHDFTWLHGGSISWISRL